MSTIVEPFVQGVLCDVAQYSLVSGPGLRPVFRAAIVALGALGLGVKREPGLHLISAGRILQT